VTIDVAASPLEPARRAEFSTPDWDAPLDREGELARVPGDATISGMFLAPMVDEAAKHGAPLPSAHARYRTFEFYPLRHHVTLMFEAAERLFPDLSARQALRKLGRGATPALLDSTLGRVMWSTAVTPAAAVDALAKAYAVNLKPGAADVVQHGEGYAIVELREVHYLMDSNHAGAFESVLRPLGMRAQVAIRRRGEGWAELLVTWDG
jgi:uncharacterized protein (TIGR02265 family)